MGSLYLRSGVLLQDKKKNVLIEGVLKVEERPLGLFIVWHPELLGLPTTVKGEGDSAAASPAPEVDRTNWIELELVELNSYRLTDDGNQLVLIQKDGTNTNPLIFLDEGPDEFLATIKRYTMRKEFSKILFIFAVNFHHCNY